MYALRSLYLASFCAVLFVSGCSLLIDADRDQCASDDDCSHIGLDGTCRQGVCVASQKSAATQGAGQRPAAQADGCDGGAGCMTTDAGTSMSSNDTGACSSDDDCDTSERCFKQECSPKAGVAPFICDPKTPEASATVHFQMAVREFVSEKAPVGMRVSACRMSDVSCVNPVATLEDASGAGMIELDLPFEFDGFLEVRSDDALTALWYFTTPLVVPVVAKDLGAVAPSTLTLLASIAGYEPDMSKGLVILEAFDCANATAGGIHFEESKKGALPFFIIDGVPSVESTITVRDALTDSAAGGFLNADPGFTIFTARIGVNGPVLGMFNGHVRANTVTYLDIHP